jgi:hypothetical protein
MILGMEDSTVLGLTGIIAGVLTASMSFWWNYKTRALPHREFLYQKQIEAYIEVATAISRSVNPCHNYLGQFEEELAPEKRKEFEKLTETAYADLWEPLQKSMTILPRDVVTAICDLFLKLVTEVHKSGNPMEMRDMLTDAELDVYSAVRKNAGIEPLTEEMRQVFGER